MNQRPTDNDIEDFVRRLEGGDPLVAQDAEIVRYFLATITAQADALAKLSFKLDVLNAFNAVAGETIAGSGISSLRSSLSNPQLNDFTFQEARERIDSVLREIQNQNQLVQVLSSIAKFAVRFAPLIL